MARADSNTSIRSPADSSRRRFLTVAAAASAVSAGALAAAAMPPAALQACSLDDSALVRLEAQIFQHKEAIAKMEPEVERLEDIWLKEEHRLHDEFEATRTGPTFSERKAIIDAMPESKSACGCAIFRRLNAK
jgi:hypothetical protein